MPRAIATYELYIAALKLGIAIIPSSEMLRTKDLQYRITHGEIDAVIAMHHSQRIRRCKRIRTIN